MLGRVEAGVEVTMPGSPTRRARRLRVNRIPERRNNQKPNIMQRLACVAQHGTKHKEYAGEQISHQSIDALCGRDLSGGGVEGINEHEE